MGLTPLFVLPLVGGYAFSNIWKGSLYHSSRESGHRLYFRSVFYAIFLVVCACLIHILIYECQFYIWFLSLIREAIPTSTVSSIWGQESKASILFMSFAIGPLFANILNLPTLKVLLKFNIEKMTLIKFNINKKKFIKFNVIDFRPFYLYQSFLLKNAISNNDFELLLYRSFENNFPILFSMSSGKAYIGHTVRAPNPIEQRRAVRILPLLSGYRDPDTHELIITTDYYTAISELEKELNNRKEHFKKLELEDIEVVLPADQIQSSHLFDLEVYENHFNNGENEPPESDLVEKSPKDSEVNIELKADPGNYIITLKKDPTA